ncbi:MAG TPA: hypothetical protein VLW85_05815 [Myxococcales bacterium]|nr:hypothetical protein [Myxococcales bacterium]
MLLLVALLLGAPARDRPLLVFRGNVALVDDVYRGVLDLPKGSKATPELARTVGQRLRRFLHVAGYILATVKTEVQGDQIVVDLDEGHLDKIAFIGADVFQTLRLKMDLRMPEKVLNKPELEKQLQGLSDRLHLEEFSYELVPSPDFPQTGPQLDQMGLGDELSMFMPGFPYELHILVVPGKFHPGLSPQIGIDSLEGGGLGLSYQGQGLVQPDDRFDVEGKISAGLRDHLNVGGSRPVLTHAEGDIGWDGAPIHGVRPSLHFHASDINRQRGDLYLETVQGATLTGLVQAKVFPGKYLWFTLGGGLERRFLFMAEGEGCNPLLPCPQPPPGISANVAQTRPFGDLTAGWLFNPEELRRDRKHELSLQTRVYFPALQATATAVRTDVRYQKLFPIGWHELWLSFRGLWLSGDVLYTEEQSLGGEGLRSVFSNVFVTRMAALGVEFRYSLLRDLFKVGLWDNPASFTRVDRLNGNAEMRAVADAFGVSLHALFIDEFQLDFYFGTGLYWPGRVFGSGAALQLSQAF